MGFRFVLLATVFLAGLGHLRGCDACCVSQTGAGSHARPQVAFNSMRHALGVIFVFGLGDFKRVTEVFIWFVIEQHITCFGTAVVIIGIVAFTDE